MAHHCDDPMCALNNEDGIEGFMAQQEELIAKFGFGVVMTATMEGDPFAYTMGRAAQGLPELLILGVGPVASGILNDIAPLLTATAADGFFKQPDWKLPLYAGEAHDVEDIAKLAYGRQAKLDPTKRVKVMQVVMPDANGRMPWEKGCDPKYIELQPLHMNPPSSRRPS